MSDFKQVLEEKEERLKYQSRNKKFFFFFIMIIVAIILKFFFKISLFSNPFSHLLFTLVMFIMFSFVWWWSKGLPKSKILRFIPEQLCIILVKVAKVLMIKIPICNTILKGGKLKELEKFFYPETTFKDNIPRSNNLTHFTSNRYDLDTLFDFGKYSTTDNIIMLFRDKKREKLERLEKNTTRTEKEKNSVSDLEKYMQKYKDIPSYSQENLYTDLFSMLQGIYNSYTTEFGEKLEIDLSIKTPLKVKYNKKLKKVGDITIDDDIDIISNGKVHFSIDMIMDTIQQLTFLYDIFLEHRLGKGRLYHINKEETVLQRFEMFFKFYMLRRILKNYSNIPSGWLCVKMEDYTARSIASSIDRDMIISINEKNNGTHPSYSSDVEASQFTFTYWQFITKEERILKVMESLAFIFDATKEVHEITANRLAKEEERKLRQELEERYKSIKDEDLVFLDTSEKAKEFGNKKEMGAV